MIRETLERLRAEDNLRELPRIEIRGKYVVCDGKRYLNLSSNDYLGLACSDADRKFMQQQPDEGTFLLSNPSSRLVTGNSSDYARLESALSELFGGRSALVAGSGYLVNAGVLPALTGNDTEHLERLLARHRDAYRNVWIVTESIFSMDGDCAPLRKLAELKDKYRCKLYVDEAHAFGAYGPGGRGLAAQESVEDACDIRIATLGKAIASQGAFVITDPLTREFLVNRMRTLIFSTALPPISLRWSEHVVRALSSMDDRRERLREYARTITGDDRHTHIIPIMAGENARAIEMSRRLREAGFWVVPIRYPTVPKGTARIRVSLSAALEREDILQFVEACKSIG